MRPAQPGGLDEPQLIGVSAGIVEIVPVLALIAAGAPAIGVGLTQSWQLALAAGIVVLTVRLLEDYVVIPRVMGHVTGISPLLVLVGVATPLLAVLVTLVDVVVRDRDPAKEGGPAVLFAKESTGR